MNTSAKKRNERKNLLILSINVLISLSLCFFSDSVFWQCSSVLVMFTYQHICDLFPIRRLSYRNSWLWNVLLLGESYEIVGVGGDTRRIWHVELRNMVWVLNRLSIDGAEDIIKKHQHNLAVLHLHHSPSLRAELYRVMWKLGLWDWV